MKKLYIKTAAGLVLATEEQMKDAAIPKYASLAGEFVQVDQKAIDADFSVAAPAAPASVPVGSVSATDQLVGLLKDMGGTMAAISERQEKMEAALAANKEALAKGFPIHQDIKDAPADMSNDDIAKMFPKEHLAAQGRQLQAKLQRPGYVMTEQKREDMAKYMLLFLKAGIHQDPAAKRLFHQTYGEVPMETKTEIGDGGNVFPVPDILMSEILSYARESSVILRDARIVDMTSIKMSFPLETGGVSVGWGNTTAMSNPTISEVELDAEELSAYTQIRNTQLVDTRSDVVSWVSELLANAIGQELDDVAFNGTGSKAGCSGILSALCGYSVVQDSGKTTFAGLTADNLSAMIAKLDGVRKQGAKFYMNGAVIHYLRTLKDEQSRPIFVDSLSAQVPGRIYGYDYQEVVKCPSTTAANKAYIAFGNPKHFFLGRRLDSTALSVNPYLAWTTNRTAFKIYSRWALKMALPAGFVRLLTAAS